MQLFDKEQAINNILMQAFRNKDIEIIMQLQPCVLEGKELE